MINSKEKNISITCTASILALLVTSAVLADGGSSHVHGNVVAGESAASTLREELEPFTQPYTPRSILAAATNLGQPAQFGQWSDVSSWPVIAIHANLLPNGKVLAWDATPDDFQEDPHVAGNYTTRVSLWDPQKNLHIPTINDTNGDLFCAGASQLWDGRILFAGGDSGENGTNDPLSNTNIYDHTTNTWREVANMAAPRWYSSVAALGNGEMLTYGGFYAPTPIAEVFQFNETWRPLAITEPPGYVEEYPWLQTTPEGNVMSFGPQNTIQTFDTSGDGSLTVGQVRDEYIERRYGSYAMYDIGKVLVNGGTEEMGGVPSYSSSVIIDTATQQTTDTGSMITGRTQHNLTILADGSVLATGGNSDGAELVSANAGVFQPEIWRAETGIWQPLNNMQIDRQYHSIALLLPDGRVLSAGGGYCGTCTEIGYREQNAEIFSPPYLFSTGSTLAERPAITAAPEKMDYANTYSVTASDSGTIAKVHLIKLGSVTHSQNQDQRLVPLTYTSSGNTLQVSSPANRFIAPPGYYMLIVVNNNGVPSVSKMVKVGQPLLTSGSLVTNSIRGNEVDEYVIQSTAEDKTFIVKLSNQSSDLRLQVNGVSQDGSATAVCDNNAPGEFECRLSNQAPTRWTLAINSSTETPYTLQTTLSTETDPSAIQPIIIPPVVVVGSGSLGSNGVLGLGLYLSLCGFVFWRRQHKNHSPV